MWSTTVDAQEAVETEHAVEAPTEAQDDVEAQDDAEAQGDIEAQENVAREAENASPSEPTPPEIAAPSDEASPQDTAQPRAPAAASAIVVRPESNLLPVPGHPGVFAADADSVESYRRSTAGWRRADRADELGWVRFGVGVAASYASGFVLALGLGFALNFAPCVGSCVVMPHTGMLLGYMFGAPIGTAIVGELLGGMAGYADALMGSFWGSFFFQAPAMIGVQAVTTGDISQHSMDAAILALAACNALSALASGIGYEIASGSAAGHARTSGIALAPRIEPLLTAEGTIHGLALGVSGPLRL